MAQHTFDDREGDVWSLVSFVTGLVVAFLTGLVHLQISASSHFDFLYRDTEYYLVFGLIAAIVALSAFDLRAGLVAIRHLRHPHARYAKPLTIAGVSLGAASLLPAVLLLAFMALILYLNAVWVHAPIF